MTDTRTGTDEATGPRERDVISRLADRGEEALHRLAELPGGNRALRAFNDLKERVDDLSRRVRGVDELEARVEALEREVAYLRLERDDSAAAPAGGPPA